MSSSEVALYRTWCGRVCSVGVGAMRLCDAHLVCDMRTGCAQRLVEKSLEATTSCKHPRTVVKRLLCAAVGLQPMFSRSMVPDPCGGPDKVVVVQGTKYQVTKRSGVDILHLLEVAGVVLGLDPEHPRPLGRRPPHHTAGVWEPYDDSVCVWAQAVGQWLTSNHKVLSFPALARIVEYLVAPAEARVVACGCAQCTGLVAVSPASLPFAVGDSHWRACQAQEGACGMSARWVDHLTLQDPDGVIVRVAGEVECRTLSPSLPPLRTRAAPKRGLEAGDKGGPASRGGHGADPGAEAGWLDIVPEFGEAVYGVPVWIMDEYVYSVGVPGMLSAASEAAARELFLAHVARGVHQAGAQPPVDWSSLKWSFGLAVSGRPESVTVCWPLRGTERVLLSSAGPTQRLAVLARPLEPAEGGKRVCCPTAALIPDPIGAQTLSMLVDAALDMGKVPGVSGTGAVKPEGKSGGTFHSQARRLWCQGWPQCPFGWHTLSKMELRCLLGRLFSGGRGGANPVFVRRLGILQAVMDGHHVGSKGFRALLGCGIPVQLGFLRTLFERGVLCSSDLPAWALRAHGDAAGDVTGHDEWDGEALTNLVYTRLHCSS